MSKSGIDRTNERRSTHHSSLITHHFLLLAFAPSLAIAAERLNIVLILTDDQGWYELGCHDNPHISTPVLDRLAATSVEMTRFYASPVCTPTRACLMTGRYYQRTGAIDTYMGRDTLDAG